MLRLSTKSEQGFTIVELITVITVMGILISIVFGIMFDFYQSNVASLRIATQVDDTSYALHTIENDLTLATGHLSKVTPVTSPQGSDNATAEWSFKGTGVTDRVLIAQSYATTGAPTDDNRTLVKSTGGTGGCGSSTNTSYVKNTTIYFVRDQTLYRRTIVGSDGCAPGPFQKNTCASANISTSPCQSSDAKLLTDVTSFIPQYFAAATDSSPIDVYNEPSDAVVSGQITASKAITVGIQTSRRVNGIMNTYQNTIRINKFNQ